MDGQAPSHSQIMQLQNSGRINHAWLARIFSANAAKNGGVVRRKIRDVHREVGRATFIAEVQRRGFHLITCSDQYLVICHDGQLRVIC